ncbi:MAG: hypothetical protein ACOC1F_12480, partial [Myxococcota bacterium]
GHRYVIESSVTPSGLVDLDYDNLYTDNLDGEPRFVKWLDVRYADLSELVASDTIEQHGFAMEPAYEAPAAGDFTLAEGSGLIDVGAVLEGVNDRDMVGGGPDLGAYERGGTTPGWDGGAGGSGPDGGIGGVGGSAGGDASEGGSGGSDAGVAGSGGLPPTGDYPGEPLDPGCGCRTTSGGSGYAGVAAVFALLWTGRRGRRGRKLAAMG